MGDSDPISLLFGGMEKLGPGDNAHTMHVLRLLPRQDFRVIVDAGCGSGRQTLALARALGTPVHAVDNYQPFLDALARRAEEEQLGKLVCTHCMDMKDIPEAFPLIDLLWSEGAAYNIGFANALSVWARALVPGGFAVVSELTWLEQDTAPTTVRDFFRVGYPEMRSTQQNADLATRAGYKLLGTHMLPREAWFEGYYDVLATRAKALLDHTASSVREFAAETIREIKVFEQSDDSYGYVFFLLQRGQPGAAADGLATASLRQARG